jgi:alpha-galactosidase/6-phospho-beta-glucosidase family protein
VPRRYFSAWPAEVAMPDFPALLVECGLTLCDGMVTPLPLQPMPRSIKAMCDLLRASEELAIVAAVTRSRKLFIEALAIHPSCRSLQQAERAVDTLIKEVGLELVDVAMPELGR